MAKTPFELKGKRVFVAGHGGMVGSALLRRLAQEHVERLTAGRDGRMLPIEQKDKDSASKFGENHPQDSTKRLNFKGDSP